MRCRQVIICWRRSCVLTGRWLAWIYCCCWGRVWHSGARAVLVVRRSERGNCVLEAVSLILACAASMLGFCLLALGQERHWHAVTSSDVSMRIGHRLLFWTGLSGQLFALPLMIYSEGPGFGALLWGVLLTAMASSVAFTLAWRPRLLLPLAQCIRRHTSS